MLFASPAIASPLVGDLSQYRIEMDASFNGTRLFLFGARNDIGDIVIAIRGPAKNYMIRKKEPIGGIWVNRARMKLFDIPSFYAIASSKPLEEIEAGHVFERLKIGQPRLFPAPSASSALAKHHEFTGAFLAHQQARGLYNAQPIELKFMGEMLFKATIEFPDTIPPGEYTAEMYLVRDGEIAGLQSIPIKVSKTGLDAFLYNYAHRSPLFYGLTAILLALCAGWFTGRWFERS
jgi:uncharacterized protein (TIGR02186 family)